MKVGLIRNLVSGLLGILVFFLIVSSVEFLSSSLYPVPQLAGQDLKAAYQNWSTTAPLAAFLLLILGYFLGTLAGSTTASAFAGQKPANMGYLVTGIFLAGGVMNFATIPHPIWVIIACSSAFVVAGLLGAGLGTRIWAGRKINQPR